MIIALIHWRIKPDEKSQASFLKHWKTKNSIANRTKLIAEFLSDSLKIIDFPYITWHLDPESLGDYRSYVTVGIWEDTEAFEKEVAAYFNDDKPLLPFEKYRRRRVMFRPIARRRGKKQLPHQDSNGVK